MKIDDYLRDVPLSIRLTHPLGSREMNGVVSKITLVDDSSGLVVAEIEMTQADFFNFMAGRIVGRNEGPTRLINGDEALKLGKQEIRVSRSLKRLPYRDNQGDRLDRWVDDAARVLGAGDGAGEWRSGQGGTIYVTVRFYGNPEDGFTEEWRLQQQRILDGLSLANLGVTEVDR